MYNLIGNWKLIVRNLAFQATKNELRQLFSAFGSVKKVRIPKKMGGNHRGFAFVDPHGDTAEKLLSMVPKERTEDVMYFCPSDMDYPMGLNLFEFYTPEQKDFLIQETLNMLYKL